MSSAEDNAKFAAGAAKWPVSEVPPVAIRELGAVMKNGADKYGPFNWRATGVDVRTYYNAAQRHLMAMWDGQWRDSGPGGSGLPHAAHVMACMAIILDAASLGNLEDNRPEVAGALAGGGEDDRAA